MAPPDMQAFLITAYKDEPHLRRLVRFCSGFAKVFVHLDRKSPIPVSAVEEEGGVALKRHRVGWGSYAHLSAIIDLLRLAVNDPDVDYIHVVSGQDIPLHSAEWFVSHYAGCDEIQGHVVPTTHPSVNARWYERYWLSTLLDLDKRNIWVRRLDDVFEAVQSKLGVRRPAIGALRPYKSLVYVSFPAAAGRYALDYHDTHRLFRWDLHHCLIAEEFFFMTIFMNSPFVGQVTDRDIHYCDWSERNGASPAYLDDSDFDRLYGAEGETQYVFARKVDSRLSEGLIRRIWETCDA